MPSSPPTRTSSAPVCGKHDFTPDPQVQPDVQDRHRGHRGLLLHLLSAPPRPRRASLSTSPTSSAPPARSCPSASVRWARRSATRSPPGNFTFRTREFEQMECEFFCKPGTDLEWFAYWKDYCVNWLLSLGISRRTCGCATMSRRSWPSTPARPTDIEYAFPFTDWGELWGHCRPHRLRSGPPSGGQRQEP